MTVTPRTNRGPSAAAGNRAALIAAARVTFDELGIDAPLSAVARRAGVGQGSLYRHFPDRLSLAMAAFDENMAEIEAYAERPEATLRGAIDLVTHHAAGASALISLIARQPDDARVKAHENRLRAVFARLWDQARGEQWIGPTATVDDLVLAITLLATAMAHAPREARQDFSVAAWALLERGLGR